jgi:hypothetical protein
MLSSLNKGIISILFFLLPYDIYSQKDLKAYTEISDEQEITDSLYSIKDQLNTLNSKKGNREADSLRLELANRIAALYINRSKDTALYYVQTALTEAKSLKITNLMAVSLYTLAYIHKYYKEYPTAEKIYVDWMEIRRKRDDDEYRWALHEMRQFYCLTKSSKQLEQIEEEWLKVLDRQLDQGHLSPWYDKENGSPEDNYEGSVLPILRYLIKEKHYFIAEKSALHIIKKYPKYFSDWEIPREVYGLTEFYLLNSKDTATLVIWYEHWFNSFEKYGPGKDKSIETFSGIAQYYISGYFKMDKYFDKFYPLMMNYVSKTGGEQAVHQMLLTSSTSYIASLPVRTKVNLLLILSCIKVDDKTTMEKTYKRTDKIIQEYIKMGNSKPDLIKLLIFNKNKTTDIRFKEWCDGTIESIVH